MNDSCYDKHRPQTDLILIGGTSKIPYIRESVKKITGLQPCTNVDPEICVAQGASIYAPCLSGTIRDMVLVDVTPSTYSIAVKGGKVSPIIVRNTSIPTIRSQVFTTAEDNQTEITISVFEGEKSDASQNIFMGVVHITSLPPAPAGVTQIEVGFEVWVDNTLTVVAKDLTTGREVKAVMESPYRLNPAQIKVLQRKVWNEIYSIVRSVAIVFAKKIEDFLSQYQNFLNPKQASLLAAGKELIYDYLGRNVSRKELQTLVSSVYWTYNDVILSQIESIAGSPEFTQWVSNAANIRHIPSLLNASFEDFEKRFGNTIKSIVTLFKGEEIELRDIVKQKLFAKVKESPTVTLYAAIIFSKFVSVHTKIQGINITEAHDRILLIIFLLGELNKSTPQVVRRAVAQEIFNTYKNTNCLFLYEYIISETDPEVASWLARCIRENHTGVWLKRYFDADPVEKERLKNNSIFLQEAHNDAVWALNHLSSEVQLAILESLKELGVKECISNLISLLAVKLDDKVKIKLITLLASSQLEQVIVPLLKTLADESMAVQHSAIIALEGYRDLMSPDISRFFELARRIIDHGHPVTFLEKLFLSKFTKKYKELDGVVSILKNIE